MKIYAIIQARMNSTRFPGKVLYSVHKKPMLSYMLERVNRCQELKGVIVATSVEKTDEPIVQYCIENNVPYFRGPLNNVAERFKEIIEYKGLECFIRLSGDSPLMDPEIISKGILHFNNYGHDFVTNIMPRTYPKGQSVEIVRSEVFLSAYPNMKEKDDFEHVTPIFYRNPSLYNIYNFENEGGCLADINLSVDTAEDMERFKLLVSRMKKSHLNYGLNDIMKIYHLVSHKLDI